MTAPSLALFFLMGLAVGSFLNVCIDRLPAGESIAGRTSHCAACGHRLRARDLVPLLSYLWLRGRCRDCHAALPLRLPLVELATGLLFLFFAWHTGAKAHLLFALAYASLLVVIFVTDMEQ